MAEVAERPKGNIAREMMKDMGLSIDDAKLQQEQKLNVESNTGTPGANTNTELKPGDAGYVEPVALKPGDAGYIAPADPVLKPGDPGYVAPAALKPGDEGYIAPVELKPGDAGYIAPAALKPGDSGYIAPAVVPIDDTVLLNEINTRLGTSYKTLEEAKPKPAPLTKEEQIAFDEKENNDAIAYAIKEGKVNTKLLDEYAVDRAKPAREIALSLFKAKIMKEDKTLTEADAEEKFKEYFHEYDEKDSITYKMRQQDMKFLADSYIANKYAKVMSIKDEYSDFRSSTERRTQYNTSLAKAVTTLPREMKFELETEGEGGAKIKHNYSFNFDDTDINAVKEQFEKDDSYAAFGSGVADEKLLQDAFNTALLKRSFSNIVSVVAKSHADKLLHEEIARRKNIPSDKGTSPAQSVPGTKRNAIAREAIGSN